MVLSVKPNKQEHGVPQHYPKNPESELCTLSLNCLINFDLNLYSLIIIKILFLFENVLWTVTLRQKVPICSSYKINVVQFSHLLIIRRIVCLPFIVYVMWKSQMHYLQSRNRQLFESVLYKFWVVISISLFIYSCHKINDAKLLLL